MVHLPEQGILTSPFVGAEPRSTRRRMFSAMGLGAAASVMSIPHASAATVSPASQNVLLSGADPTGIADSSPAFRSAYSALPPTGGSIIVPAGKYLLLSPLSFGGKPLSIRGEGSAWTLLLMGHTGAAVTYNGMDQSYPSTNAFSVIGVSVCGPTNGSSAIVAFAVYYPASANQNETGYQYVFIDDVQIGAANINFTNGCNILYGFIFRNIWKSVIRNTRMFSPGNRSIAFIVLQGTFNVDVSIVNCHSDSPFYGVAVQCESQGISLIDSTFISQTGFSSNFTGASVLGLYIAGCEFNTFTLAADVFNVTQSYISDTHFSCQGTTSSSVVAMTSSLGVRMSNIIFAGSVGANGSGGNTSIFGVILKSCNLCQINGALFINLGNGLLFSTGCQANSAVGLQLVNQNLYPSLQPGPAAIDSSGRMGIGANNAQWQTATGIYVTLK